ncbi:hypothetical protein SAMN05421761_1303 [Belliella pelovolcani]|uniref:Uncharacterized protein n=1 Tax=Belliella pelovolcani TaxID=529505 RepID=A0A1N7Q4N0_9BACT|nr:hypothetical protein SAMN05421761_1303 [Belliella pelovolcani]
MDSTIQNLIKIIEKKFNKEIFILNKKFNKVQPNDDNYIFRYTKSTFHKTDFLICKYHFKLIHQPFKMPTNVKDEL